MRPASHLSQTDCVTLRAADLGSSKRRHCTVPSRVYPEFAETASGQVDQFSNHLRVRRAATPHEAAVLGGLGDNVVYVSAHGGGLEEYAGPSPYLLFGRKF